MSGPWSIEQREWLQALGFDVLALVHDAGTSGARPQSPVEDADAYPACALFQALCRAAGGAEPRAVVGLVANLDALRISPAGKRALWPRLRAMRKARRR